MTKKGEKELKKEAALELALQAVRKSLGKDIVISNTSALDIECFSSGCALLDYKLGGGYPRGRIIELLGPNASGKSTMALHATAEIQKIGGNALYVDIEHALDTRYAANIGVDVDKLLISQPDYGEQALQLVDQLVESGTIDLVVVDSVAALVPKKELDGEIGDSSIGLQARLMSQAMRKLAGSADKHNTTIIFINQIRQKIGVMFGTPEVPAGGLALQYYASQRLDIRRTNVNKEGNEAISNTTKVKVVKNKIAPPFREAIFDIIYGVGIDKIAAYADLGIDKGYITQENRLIWNIGEVPVKGKPGIIKYLKENPDTCKEIENFDATKKEKEAPILEEESNDGVSE